MEIHKTKEYDKFTLIKGNRIIIPGQVAKLTSSILKNNMLSMNPIVVNENFEVIDGQHRLEVAKNNDLDVYYVIIPGGGFSEIITLNASSRVWNSRDYLYAYASRGMEDYVWFMDFMENYAISVTEALAFCFGTDNTGPRTALITGRLELSDDQKETANSRADLLWGLRAFIKRSGFVPRAFLYEVIRIHDEGKAKNLLNGVRKLGKPFTPEADKKSVVEQLRSMMV